jgi:stress-induced morphogen
MAMQQRALEELVAAALPGSTVTATDLTGTEDHWGLRVEWGGFAGKSLLEQHRAVMAAVKPLMKQDGTGEVHAVQIQAVVPNPSE